MGANKLTAVISSMNEYVRVGLAARLIGVGTQTIRRWDADGKIVCRRTVGGHRSISLVEITRILTGEEPDTIQRKLAIYARVSSHDQKKNGDLERQVNAAKEYCREQGETASLVFTDVASGLKTNRPGLAKLCQQIKQGRISSVIATYPDRLTSFGLEYLERLFHTHGTTIAFLRQPLSQSVEQELVQDLIAIITSFRVVFMGYVVIRRKT